MDGLMAAQDGVHDAIVYLFGESKEPPEHLVQMVYWTLFFYAFELVSWVVLRWVVPTYMEGLNPIDQRSYVTKSTSTLHAAMTTGFSGYIIHAVSDIRHDEMDSVLPMFQALCALSGGFFLLDIWGMGRHAFSHYPADLAHHLVSLSIAVKGVFATEYDPLMGSGPFMLLVEATTVFMNTSVLLTGLRHSPRPKDDLTPAIKSWNLKLQMAFALSFLVLRALMFPVVIGHMQWSWPERFATYMGGGLRPFCYLLVVMQWWWMYKIAKIAKKSMSKAKSEGGSKKNE